MREPVQTIEPINTDTTKQVSNTYCNRKNLQKGLIIFCYFSYTIYSYVKFQLDLKETNTYDLGISIVIGVLLSIAYRLGNNGELRKICEQLDLQNKIYSQEVNNLTERLSQIPPWVSNSIPPEEEHDEREIHNTSPQLTERQLFEYRIKIPRTQK